MNARRKKRSHRTMGRLVRGVLIVILMGGLLGGLGWAAIRLKHLVGHMELWRVRFVQWPQDFPQTTIDQYNTALIGRNLFAIDIKAVERTLRQRHPQWEGLRVQRIPPHGLLVAGLRRKPLMILKTKNNSWLVDDQGWVMQQGSSQENVPVVDASRLSFKFPRPRVGFPLRAPQIQFIRTVLKTFQNEKIKKWRLSKCVWETAELFYCEAQREGNERPVRLLFDRSTFEQRWPALALLSQRTDLNWDEINYIDLRQQDPVLGWLTVDQIRSGL